MTPVRVPLEGPFARSVREALESVVSPDAAQGVIATALLAAGRATIPEDAPPFAAFLDGSLRATVVAMLGPEALDIVNARLSHVVRMAQSQVLSKRMQETIAPPPGARADDELWEEDSAIRMTPAGLEAAETGRRSALDTARPPEPFRPHDAARPAEARVAPGARGGPDTVRPVHLERSADPARAAAAAPSMVLVLSLDPLLVADVGLQLQSSRVLAISSMNDLLARATGVAGRVAIVVDTALPTIDVPTVASLAPALPREATIVLWGMSERQKERLVAVFPVCRDWIASGASGSVADLLR